MKTHGRRPLDAETAEKLLGGHPTALRGSRQLRERLAAAATAAFPGELAGEDAAAAAFLGVTDVDLVVRQAGRPLMIKSALVAKLLTLKAAAIAVTAVSIGGVALAASTGVLPNPLNQAPGNAGQSAPAHSNGSDATPSPSLEGLCTAFLAGAASNERVLENPAFGALVNAAGGEGNIEAYCAGLGVTKPGPDRGSGPTDHPTGPPSDAGPSQHPTPSHPTGPPSTPPSTP